MLHAEGPNFFEMGSRFLNELLPWGDPSKGLAQGKRDAMVVKYMEKTGISKAEAEKEVDEYLQGMYVYECTVSRRLSPLPHLLTQFLNKLQIRNSTLRRSVPRSCMKSGERIRNNFAGPRDEETIVVAITSCQVSSH